MDQVQTGLMTREHTRSLAFIGLTIAIMAVSAWITVPIGPVPFTLQMFAVTFAIVVLQPREAIVAIAGYLLLGAIGVPVFSGMRGGFGVLVGPTGGFLWGYLFGVSAAVLFLHFIRTRTNWDVSRKKLELDPVQSAQQSTVQKFIRFIRIAAVEIIAGIIFTAIAYVCGCMQYMMVAGVGIEAAFMVCVAPFMFVDLCKILAAVACARVVRTAVRY